MFRRSSGARSSAAEHLTFNQRVDGSIPSGLTTNSLRFNGPKKRTQNGA